MKEMICGMQASKDVKLSNISRALMDHVLPIKTEDRLSRNLSDEDLSCRINNHIMRHVDDKIDDTMVIAIDPGDMMNPCAKAMENLCNIYDSSEHEKARGYHLCQVTAANLTHDRIVPLYCEAYSSEAVGYPCSTEKLIEINKKVKTFTGTKDTWAIDRQGDNIDLIHCFTDESLQFVTRLKMAIYLHFGKNSNRQVRTERIDRYVDLRHKAHIYVAKDGKEKFIHLTYGAINVVLPEYPDFWYTLVIIKRFRQQPMLLLTNKQVCINNNKQLWQIIEIYLTPWKCDECYRYIKQSYNMEDFRVLGYTSVRNFTVQVQAIAYFTSIYLGISIKLKIMVQKISVLSKIFFGVPSFYIYAMVDGIFALLRHSKQGIIEFKSRIGPHHDTFQLSLFHD